MHINGVNYISNATDNVINQAGNNQSQIIVPSGLSSKEAGIALLKSLNAGDSFSGQITNITQNEITLMLSDQVSVNATLADALSYNIGDVASFSIKENNGDKIVLKSEQNPELKNLMNEQTITTALRNAGVTINETTVNLVNNLMKQNLPIDSKTINTQLMLLDRTPKATVEDVVYLTKMDIPITPENVEAFHNYQEYSNGISSQVNNMTDGLQQALSELPKDVLGTQLFEILNSYSETVTPGENLVDIMPKESISVLKEQINSLATPQNSSQVLELVTKLNNGKITPKDFLQGFADLVKNIQESPADISKILNGKEFKEVLNNFLRQEMFIEPKEINHENIKKLFAKIIRDNETVTAKLSLNPHFSSFVENSNSVSGNIEFMNQINHFMNFVQIPLKMTGQNAHGDLYVYKNGKKSSFEDKDELKAFLHLDMDNLGPLDVLVTLKQNQHVTTNFKVESDEILDYIEAHIDELNMALSKLGYNVDTKVELNTTPYTFNNVVLANELPAQEIRRFSFDVRA